MLCWKLTCHFMHLTEYGDLQDYSKISVWIVVNQWRESEHIADIHCVSAVDAMRLPSRSRWGPMLRCSPGLSPRNGGHTLPQPDGAGVWADRHGRFISGRCHWLLALHHGALKCARWGGRTGRRELGCRQNPFGTLEGMLVLWRPPRWVMHMSANHNMRINSFCISVTSQRVLI